MTVSSVLKGSGGSTSITLCVNVKRLLHLHVLCVGMRHLVWARLPVSEGHAHDLQVSS